jgi:hypothetical protein
MKTKLVLGIDQPTYHYGLFTIALVNVIRLVNQSGVPKINL